MSSSAVSSVHEWEKEVQHHLPHLSPTQARVLGKVSYAMMMLKHCGTTKVSHWLAEMEGHTPSTERQQIREWYYEAAAKRGAKRREIRVDEHFADLLAWVLEGWEGEKRLVLVLDATNNSERFTCLSVGVVLQGCLIPVAWHLRPANAPGEWKAHWLRLLAVLAGAVPPSWHVVVMTDAGLYAPWLYQAIQANGWHPMMRVGEQMGFCAQGETQFRPIGHWISRRGRRLQRQGSWAERGERLSGTLLGAWEVGYERKLAVVTDETGQEAQVAFYQMRFWTETGYKDQKRGGWHWEQTKMQDAERASRLWFALAVTMLWAVRVGSEAEGHPHAGTPRKTGKRGRPCKRFRRPRGREQSIIECGQQTISQALQMGRTMPLGHVRAQPWPRSLYPVGKPSQAWERRRKRKEQRRLERHRQHTWHERHQAKLAQQREREATRKPRPQQAAEPQHHREKRAQDPQWCPQGQEQRRLEHEREQQGKRDARQCRQQEQQQVRLERQHWHEECRQARQAREQRRQERLARQNPYASSPTRVEPRHPENSS